LLTGDKEGKLRKYLKCGVEVGERHGPGPRFKFHA